MIASQDRSYYIGASDVEKVIGNWKTKTWHKWWMQKIGVDNSHFDNVYTLAGTHLEHRILESLYIPMEFDKQFINEELRLRVNLDGNTENCIYECKTFVNEKDFKLPKKYINQVQVQMFVSGIHQTVIVAYGLEEEDYNNFFRPIDAERRRQFPISFNPEWIERVYLPKHLILKDCLEKGVMPDESFAM
jgi:predicted phage-related endonuclease